MTGDWSREGQGEEAKADISAAGPERKETQKLPRPGVTHGELVARDAHSDAKILSGVTFAECGPGM